MCGILGAFPRQDDHVFLPALNSMYHRGPDGFGVWHEDNNLLTLGHRRLSILDLSENGKQPMHYQNFTITFNGEVFNFMEIREELEAKGFTFQSESDTEVILAAYQEWGADCQLKFNGMWAFAIWDHNRKELFLSRDRFGIKPLYYAFNGETFAFASEMKALYSFLPQIRVSRDFNSLRDNMFDYETTDKCLLEGLSRFPAGHFATFRPGDKTLEPKQWWNTLDHLEEVPETYEEQVEKFRELFLDAIKLRMRSDVRIGTALSGGVDSSAVICAMANINKGTDNRVSDDWQNAFCAIFPGMSLDETQFAEQVVKHLGISAVYKEIDPAKGIDKLMEYLWLFEELYITSPIPMIEIYKEIKANGVTVSIDGHGADELIGGYGGNIFDAVKDNPFSFGKISDIMNTFTHGFVMDGTKPPASLTRRAMKQVLVRYRDLALTDKKLIKEDPIHGQLGYFNQYLYQEFHHKVLPTLLRNYDRYSMAASVEIRMPFMDYRLVKYCFSLPWNSKLRDGYTKHILRQSMDKYVPKEVIWRRNKIGFNTPFMEWMRGPWKEFILDMVSSQSFQESNLINPGKVKRQVEGVIHGNTATWKDGQEAWVSLAPYLWEEAVLSKAGKTPVF
ncbi:MAG: asparagine synthase (glutamine-hydrolyzing) [Bacteroidia bacterium]|nr:asparagine synthase (glutamine-hydrolyzing) [Bacteroidia bacterium]